eukprot:TRINITY_DN64465_c0_g1_i1.p1 TRINITY_DN64465_c0_g1~~TRINITY_DN64465_c0_g1_i1.p1  ORF type:complete len:1701 (+),score=309.54 TRINITY_DN64465_c0_g1_i1:129-5105(+)
MDGGHDTIEASWDTGGCYVGTETQMYSLGDAGYMPVYGVANLNMQGGVVANNTGAAMPWDGSAPPAAAAEASRGYNGIGNAGGRWQDFQQPRMGDTNSSWGAGGDIKRDWNSFRSGGYGPRRETADGHREDRARSHPRPPLEEEPEDETPLEFTITAGAVPQAPTQEEAQQLLGDLLFMRLWPILHGWLEGQEEPEILRLCGQTVGLLLRLPQAELLEMLTSGVTNGALREKAWQACQVLEASLPEKMPKAENPTKVKGQQIPAKAVPDIPGGGPDPARYGDMLYILVAALVGDDRVAAKVCGIILAQSGAHKEVRSTLDNTAKLTRSVKATLKMLEEEQREERMAKLELPAFCAMPPPARMEYLQKPSTGRAGGKGSESAEADGRPNENGKGDVRFQAAWLLRMALKYTNNPDVLAKKVAKTMAIARFPRTVKLTELLRQCGGGAESLAALNGGARAGRDRSQHRSAGGKAGALPSGAVGKGTWSQGPSAGGDAHSGIPHPAERLMEGPPRRGRSRPRSRQRSRARQPERPEKPDSQSTAPPRAEREATARATPPAPEAVARPKLALSPPSAPRTVHRYLPKFVNDVPVLINTGPGLYTVDGRVPGLSAVAFRVSKDLNDKDPDGDKLDVGTTVSGVDEGDAWIKVKVSKGRQEGSLEASAIRPNFAQGNSGFDQGANAAGMQRTPGLLQMPPQLASMLAESKRSHLEAQEPVPMPSFYKSPTAPREEEVSERFQQTQPVRGSTPEADNGTDLPHQAADMPSQHRRPVGRQASKEADAQPPQERTAAESYPSLQTAQKPSARGAEDSGDAGRNRSLSNSKKKRFQWTPVTDAFDHLRPTPSASSSGLASAKSSAGTARGSRARSVSFDQTAEDEGVRKAPQVNAWGLSGKAGAEEAPATQQRARSSDTGPGASKATARQRPETTLKPVQEEYSKKKPASSLRATSEKAPAAKKKPKTQWLPLDVFGGSGGMLRDLDAKRGRPAGAEAHAPGSMAAAEAEEAAAAAAAKKTKAAQMDDEKAASLALSEARLRIACIAEEKMQAVEREDFERAAQLKVEEQNLRRLLEKDKENQENANGKGSKAAYKTWADRVGATSASAAGGVGARWRRAASVEPQAVTSQMPGAAAASSSSRSSATATRPGGAAVKDGLVFFLMAPGGLDPDSFKPFATHVSRRDALARIASAALWRGRGEAWEHVREIVFLFEDGAMLSLQPRFVSGCPVPSEYHIVQVIGRGLDRDTCLGMQTFEPDRRGGIGRQVERIVAAHAEDAHTAVVLLHESYQMHLNVLGTRLDGANPGKGERRTLMFFLGAVRDMTPDENSAVLRACRKCDVPFVEASLGQQAEFTSKIIDVLQGHHLFGRLMPAVWRLARRSGAVRADPPPSLSRARRGIFWVLIPVGGGPRDLTVDDNRQDGVYEVPRCMISQLYCSKNEHSDHIISYVFSSGEVITAYPTLVTCLKTQHRAAPTERNLVSAIRVGFGDKKADPSLSIEKGCVTLRKDAADLASERLISEAVERSAMAALDVELGLEGDPSEKIPTLSPYVESIDDISGHNIRDVVVLIRRSGGRDFPKAFRDKLSMALKGRRGAVKLQRATLPRLSVNASISLLAHYWQAGALTPAITAMNAQKRAAAREEEQPVGRQAPSSPGETAEDKQTWQL